MSNAYENYPTVAVAQVMLDAPNTKGTNNSLSLPQSNQGPIQEKELARLLDQGYTNGLAQSLNKTKEEFGQRVSPNNIIDFSMIIS